MSWRLQTSSNIHLTQVHMTFTLWSLGEQLLGFRHSQLASEHTSTEKRLARSWQHHTLLWVCSRSGGRTQLLWWKVRHWFETMEISFWEMFRYVLQKEETILCSLLKMRSDSIYLVFLLLTGGGEKDKEASKWSGADLVRRCSGVYNVPSFLPPSQGQYLLCSTPSR